MYYIYGELVIIENFIINYIILIFTSKLIKKKVSKLRLVISSAIGSIYSLLQFEHTIFSLHILKIILSVVIIWISFYPFSVRGFLNVMIVFYTISAILGGCVIALLFMFNLKDGMVFEIHGVALYIVIMGVLLGIIVILRVKQLIVDKKLNDENIIQINICIDSNEISLTGFRDTGCSLKDPLTGKPVLLATYHSLQSILPNYLKSYLATYDHTFDTNILQKVSDMDHLGKVNFIPYNTLQHDSQYLLCYLVDHVEFVTDNNNLRINKLYVGISINELSQDNEFQALINPKLLFI